MIITCLQYLPIYSDSFTDLYSSFDNPKSVGRHFMNFKNTITAVIIFMSIELSYENLIQFFDLNLGSQKIIEIVHFI